MKLFESKFKEFIKEDYNEGNPLSISGVFNGELLDSNGNSVDVPENIRNFTVDIPGDSVVNTNVQIDPDMLVKLKDWLMDNNINSGGSAISQIAKLSADGKEFISSYIPGFIEMATNKDIDIPDFDPNNIREDLANSLQKLRDEGYYDGEVISSLTDLLKQPFELFIKAVINADITDDNGQDAFLKLFKKDTPLDAMFIPFDADNVQQGREGVYFYTVDDSDPVYVGKSSLGNQGLGFRKDFNLYKAGRVPLIFPNNAGTRGRINTEIAKKVQDAIQNGTNPDVKWYNIPIDDTNAEEVLDSLVDAGVDISRTFVNQQGAPMQNPKNAFLETLVMSKIGDENWNNEEGGFVPYIEIND